MKLTIGNIPKRITEQAQAYIGNFLVGFVRLDPEAGGVDFQLGGSGTLAHIGDRFGILTAQHVLEHLPDKGRIGLILPRSNNEAVHPSRPTIDLSYTKPISYQLGRNECDGPDLAFLVLAPSDVAWIRARKSFRNLDYRRQEVLTDKRDISKHAWALSGFPNELVLRSEAQGIFDPVMKYRGLFYLSQIQHLPDAKSFDYVELLVGHQQAQPPPRSFVGYSGGGLWHLELTGKTLRTLKLDRCTLTWGGILSDQ